MKYPELKQALFAVSLLFVFFPGSGFASEQSESADIFIVDCKTTQHYGLNSYFLLLHPPVFQAHTQALKLTEFLLQKIHTTKLLSPNAPLAQRQVIYIPVSFEPQSWVQHPQKEDFDAAARWVMQNYDYQCAKALMKPFPQLVANGPYILSSSQKLFPENLNMLTSALNPVLAQDLSNTETLQAFSWLELFFEKSWQPRQWQSMDLPGLQQVMLKGLFDPESQNMVGPKTTLAAEQFPETKSEQNTTSKFVDSDHTSQARVQIKPSENFPVNQSTTPVHNPYSDKITIQFSSVLNGAKSEHN